MGKRLIQQRRGRGTQRYRFPGFNAQGEIRHVNTDKTVQGKVTDIIRCIAHSAPLAEVVLAQNGEFGLNTQNEKTLIIAPENVKVGDVLEFNSNNLANGNVMKLKDIPEGAAIYNIELQPGDGGKIVRSAGTSARIIFKSEKYVSVILPSKKVKNFSIYCRANIGTISGGGFNEKPLYKAGNKYRKRHTKGKLYPNVSAQSMNAVDHPFGGSSSAHKGHPTIAGRFAPPGAKVGKIHPKRTGKKR